MYQRREKMTAAVIEMVRELVTPDLLRDVEVAAAESDSGENDKPIVASVGLAIKWQAGQEKPEMTARLSYSVKHVTEADRVVDPSQMPLPLGDVEMEGEQ
jgi:hypothetical protein